MGNDEHRDVGREHADSHQFNFETQFWSLVVVFNIAVFAVSLGAMLVWFRNQQLLGVTAILLGIILGALGVSHVKRVKHWLAAQDGVEDANGS